ncbi:MAG TPA: hypothetical protein VEK79_19425 [Thermoanaerobaculia bacterium]|nr:hypothetical protein [Thermoanaerobaculia bacterium]
MVLLGIPDYELSAGAFRDFARALRGTRERFRYGLHVGVRVSAKPALQVHFAHGFFLPRSVATSHRCYRSTASNRRDSGTSPGSVTRQRCLECKTAPFRCVAVDLFEHRPARANRHGVRLKRREAGRDEIGIDEERKAGFEWQKLLRECRLAGARSGRR